MLRNAVAPATLGADGGAAGGTPGGASGGNLGGPSAGGNAQEVVVLDVRNAYEWDAGHFVGAQRPLEVRFRYFFTIQSLMTCCFKPCNRHAYRFGVTF